MENFQMKVFYENTDSVIAEIIFYNDSFLITKNDFEN